MLKFTTGDMFDVNANILINTINCVGVMGCGVALAFKKKYPGMFREYAGLCRLQKIQPGVLWNYHTTDDKVIVNFPTKYHWRKQSEYSYVERGLGELKSLLMLHATFTVSGTPIVAIPALGCGHGGLDWDVVKAMITQYLGDLENVDIYVFQPHDSRQIGDRNAVH